MMMIFFAHLMLMFSSLIVAATTVHSWRWKAIVEECKRCVYMLSLPTKFECFVSALLLTMKEQLLSSILLIAG